MAFVYCALKTECLNKNQVAGMSLQMPRFYPWSIYVSFMVEKLAQGQFVVQILWFFSPSFSFHRCTILIYMLILPEGQTDTASQPWNLPKSHAFSDTGEN